MEKSEAEVDVEQGVIHGTEESEAEVMMTWRNKY
jgi:hypothetical protein